MRLAEVNRLDNNPEYTIGDVTSINLTRINGGIQSNVIPSQITACFDVRLALDVNLSDFEAKVDILYKIARSLLLKLKKYI